MAVDERARHELFLRRGRGGRLRVGCDADGAAASRRLGGRRRKRDLDALGDKLEARLLAAFRSELLAQSNAINAQMNAICAQMKSLAFVYAGTVASTATLAFTVAKLT